MEMSQLDFVIENIKREATTHRAEPFWNRYFRSYIDLKSTTEYNLLEFLKFEGGAFVNKVFLELLMRAPQASEEEAICRQLDSSLESKLRIIRSLLCSQEFASKQRLVKINGLRPVPGAVWSLFNRVASKKMFFLLIVTYLHGFLSWGDFKYLFRQYRTGKVNREELAYLLAFVYQFSFQSKFKKILAGLVKKSFRLMVKCLPQVWLFKNSANQEFILNLIFQQEMSQEGALLALRKEISNEIRHQLDQNLLARKHILDFSAGPAPQEMASSESAPSPGLRRPDIRKDIDRKYFEFEERFRGSEELVTGRLKSYLGLVEPVLSGSTAGPALDIGFGRGEWLKLLTEKGWDVQGVDSNQDLVNRTKDKGYNVICGDAVEYLEKSGKESFSLITGFHIIEHIPYEGIHSLVRAAFRALKPGGMLIFETPNPENILVGSFEFWMDPTHIKPIPSPVLSFILESYGFQQVQIVKKHPANILDSSGIDHPSLANIVFRFNLEKDYAVVARK